MIPLNEFVETVIGEGPHSGIPCVLIRIAGCNLACDWCDTSDNKFIKERVPPAMLADRVADTGRDMVLITGGEPLLCAATIELMKELIEREIKILLESNGSIPLDRVPKEVVKSVDVKTPSSGHAGSFLQSNLDFITREDSVKFVIANRQDFDWSVGQIEKHNLLNRTTVIFSPVWDRLESKALAEWILETGSPIRLSMQLHKIIGIK